MWAHVGSCGLRGCNLIALGVCNLIALGVCNHRICHKHTLAMVDQSHDGDPLYAYHAATVTHVGVPQDQTVPLFLSGMYDTQQSCVDLGGYECIVKMTEAPLLPQHNVTDMHNAVHDFVVADNTSSWKTLECLLPCIIELVDKTIADGGKCLLICVDGQSRSAAVAVAYLMAKGATYSDASAWLAARRPIVRTRFASCLKCYQPTTTGVN